MPPSRAAPLGNGPDELHADRVYLEVTRDADGPGKLASREPLARSARNRRPPAHSRSAHRLLSHGRSRPGRPQASFVPFDIRPERSLALTAPGRLSNYREGTGARPTSPALRLVRASVTPTSGNWRSYPAPKHIAQRHRLSAGPSSASRCRRSPIPHRCRRLAGRLERAILSPTTPHPRRQQQQNDATDHSRPAQAALPSAECSCVHPVRSAPPRKADTSAAAPCEPSGSGTA